MNHLSLGNRAVMPAQTRVRQRAGFTLIELLVVIVIIGILAAGLFRMIRAARDKAAIAETTAQIHAIATLLEEYKAIYGDYPVVSNTDSNGYAPLNFSFTSKTGTGGTCKHPSVINNENDTTQFGLCSHFVPRATKFLEYTAGDSTLERYYAGQYKDPTATAWKNEMRGIDDTDPLRTAKINEAADPNLQQIYRVWRRLETDGLVYEGSSPCPDCFQETYTAGAKNDAWEHALKYRNNGGAGEIISAGPDGEFGTADDITASGIAGDDED